MRPPSAEFRGIGVWSVTCVFFLSILPAIADSTWVFSVQISASVQSSPPSITLRWQPDQYGANSYTIYRKTRDATSWGSGVTLPGSATSYVDTSVTVGNAYEYQIIKAASLGYTGYGYIYAGIEVPLTESRGKLILLVANTHAVALSNELARLQSDLTGDGWQVLRRDVSPMDTPQNIRNLIINDYRNDPTGTKAVILFGHVPILQSGSLNYDTHAVRSMPADAFYGDMDGNWSSSPSFLPSDVELMVGRVDFFNMPGKNAKVPWPSELELLRNYLNKDHEWRHKLITVNRRALMGNRRGDDNGEAPAATGYRAFEPLLGPGSVVEADIADASLPANRWGPRLAAQSYLMAYGGAGGSGSSMSFMGTNAPYNDLWSTDIVGQDLKAVFVMLMGSWIGNWDSSDNFMRSFLATSTMGLTACLAGRPHWFMHHMGLGEPIGYSTRLSINNSTLYRNQSNFFTRAIYISLMGDPTLRLDPIAPPSSLRATISAGKATLTWTAAPDNPAGYHIYRALNPNGPFTRLNTALLASATFTDNNASTNSYTYMVRAIKLQSTPSGTYWNASQGIFASIDTQPIRITASRTSSTIILRWNSISGNTYRVQAASRFNPTTWSNASAVLQATGATTSWTNSRTLPQRFYRVTSP